MRSMAETRSAHNTKIFQRLKQGSEARDAQVAQAREAALGQKTPTPIRSGLSFEKGLDKAAGVLVGAKIAGDIAQIVAGPVGIEAAGPVKVEPTSTPSIAIVEPVKPGVSTHDQAFRDQFRQEKPVGPATAKSDRLSAQTERKAQVIADILKQPSVTKEWLLANPKHIRAMAEVVDPNGNKTKDFILLDSGFIYISDKDNAGNFSQYNAVNKTSIGNPSAMAVSSDGNTIIVGGEDPLRSAKTKIEIFRGQKSSPVDIHWPYGIDGGTLDLIRINDTTYLGNNGNYEGGIGQYIIKVDSQSQSTSIKAAALTEQVQAVKINTGSAYDMKLLQVDAPQKQFMAASNGSLNLQQGINIFRINYDSSEGTVERIQTVKINGVDTNLGYLFGNGTYTDTQGHLHAVRSNIDRQVLYDVNLTTKVATQEDYTHMMDGKIPDAMDGRLKIRATDIVMNNGTKQDWLAGSYAASDGTSKAILIHKQTGTFYTFVGDSESFFDQKGMKRTKFNGQDVYELAIRGYGKVVVPINPDGTPIPGAEAIYPNKGLGEKIRTLIAVAGSTFSPSGTK